MQASVLSEMCLCLSCMCDQLSDFATRVSCHAVRVCTCICLHKKNKIKVVDSCVRWRLYQSVLNPEVPLTQCFGRQILYRLFMLLSFQPGVSECVRVIICGTGVYDIKHIKELPEGVNVY